MVVFLVILTLVSAYFILKPSIDRVSLEARDPDWGHAGFRYQQFNTELQGFLSASALWEVQSAATTATKATAEPAWSIKGIVNDGGEYKVIIRVGGPMAKPGDVSYSRLGIGDVLPGGERITSISPQNIHIDRDGELQTRSLYEKTMSKKN